MIDKEIQRRNPNLMVKLVNKLARIFKKLPQTKKEMAGTSWQEIKLEISPSIKRYLEMRNVSEDEVRQVIDRAETTKEKLYQPDSGRYLAKLRIGKATFYVEYHQGTGGFVVDSAYAHKSEIVG
jgi:glutamate synthase (NADPH) small chain